MVGHLFDLPKEGGGNITTGGTESTILALKAYKKMYKSKSCFNFFCICRPLKTFFLDFDMTVNINFFLILFSKANSLK